MAAALYNRYRPRTFAEVVGQEHVTSALIGALDSGRLHHAYLFSGPRGCGKTSSARILAASLNCEQGPTSTPCGSCGQCTAIRAGSSLDVVEIDAASHGGVEDARDLRERALYVPASARYRVFIIDEAHQVSRDGFNALLKIVEEPPAHLVFVFATTEPDKVLPTIRSRTFSYAFRLVPPGALREHLARLCEAEGVAVDPKVLPLVVRAGGGSVRDAMSVLDQLIAGGATSYAQASALLGVTESVLLDDAVTALPTRDGAALFAVVERVVAAGHDPRRFAGDLLERLRDLMLLAAVPDAAERGLVDQVAGDQLVRMRTQATALGPAELSRAADVVHGALLDMRGTTPPRLLLELMCARLLLPAADNAAAATLARLEAVERRLTGAPGSPPATPSPPAAAVAAAPAEPVEAAAAPAEPAEPVEAVEAVDAAALTLAWPAVLAAVKRRSRVPHALLAGHGSVTSVRGDLVDVSIALPPLARQFRAGAGPEVLAEAIGEVVGGRWRVQVVDPPSPAAAAQPSSGDFAPGDEPEPEDADADVPQRGADPPEAAAHDPITLLRSAFGAEVIAEADTLG